MKENLISKTALLYLDRCDKAFYLYKRYPWLRARPDVKKKFLLDRGTDLGILARELFPGGTDASLNNASFSDAVRYTQDLIEKGADVIYEASFEWKGAGAMADILVKDKTGWTILEVKSSVRVYPQYVLDAGFQYFIFSRHIPVTEVCVVHPDKNYVFHRNLDIRKLFRRVSVLRSAQKNTSYYERMLEYAQKLLEEGQTPRIAVGEQCFRPGLCEFAGTCFPVGVLNDPDSVFNHRGLRTSQKLELYHSGILKTHQIPPEMISEMEVFSEDAESKQQQIPFLKELENIKNYVYFDMEFYTGPIPFLDGHRPFDAVCVSFDVYYPEQKSHRSFFLESEDMESWELLVKEMAATLEKAKGVAVYDGVQEAEYAKHLEAFFPAEAHIIHEKLKSGSDIQALIRKFRNQLPVEVRGITGLKKISDRLGYKTEQASGLKEGFDALIAYEAYRQNKNLFEREEIKQSIINYVREDTARMDFVVNTLCRHFD